MQHSFLFFSFFVWEDILQVLGRRRSRLRNGDLQDVVKLPVGGKSGASSGGILNHLRGVLARGPSVHGEPAGQVRGPPQAGLGRDRELSGSEAPDRRNQRPRGSDPRRHQADRGLRCASHRAPL